MHEPTMTDATMTALRGMHPDPFVQAAVWRLYTEAPGLLDTATYVTLSTTQGLDTEAALTRVAAVAILQEA